MTREMDITREANMARQRMESKRKVKHESKKVNTWARGREGHSTICNESQDEEARLETGRKGMEGELNEQYRAEGGRRGG